MMIGIMMVTFRIKTIVTEIKVKMPFVVAVLCWVTVYAITITSSSWNSRSAVVVAVLLLLMLIGHRNCCCCCYCFTDVCCC